MSFPTEIEPTTTTKSLAEAMALRDFWQDRIIELDRGPLLTFEANIGEAVEKRRFYRAEVKRWTTSVG